MASMPRNQLSSLLFAVILPVIVVGYNADIPFGARLNVPTVAATAHQASHKNDSEVSSSYTKLKRAPVHYEVEFPSSLSTETVNEPLKSAENGSNVTAIEPAETVGNLYVSPRFASDAVELNIASQQHPGVMPRNRQPYMVNINNEHRYQLPPLTAALPMDHFETIALSLMQPQSAPSTAYHSAAPLARATEPQVTIQYEPSGHLLEEPLFHHGGHSSSRHLHSIAASAAHFQRLDYIPGIPGKPWKDYPMFASVPKTSFSCAKTALGYGYYADVETGCQVWHYCQPDGRHNSFLCPNGTIFNQKTRVCDWFYNVHCAASIRLYGINSDLYKTPKHARVVYSHQAASLPRYAYHFKDLYEPLTSLHSRPVYEVSNDNHEIESSA